LDCEELRAYEETGILPFATPAQDTDGASYGPSTKGGAHHEEAALCCSFEVVT